MASYVLALGNPTAHRIPAALVAGGDSHAARAALERSTTGGVELSLYPSLAEARRAIDRQTVYAALDETRPRPVLYVASAAGASVARVLERGAAEAGIRVVDTHPLPPRDPQGLDVFYLVLAATILGFVTVFQVRANAPGLGLRAWLLFLGGFAVLAAATVSVVAGPVLDRLDLPLAESIGILALQILAAGAFASTMVLLAGRWAIVPTWLLFVVLGNSSSGGAVAPPLLPRPFAVVSQWLPSGATVTAIRNAVYFRGDQHWRPVAVLTVWALAWLAATAAVARARGTSPGAAAGRPPDAAAPPSA